MEEWVVGRLQEFVGRGDREGLEPRLGQALIRQEAGGHASYRVAQNLPALARGLVVTEQGVIPDHARVRRVFHLTNAITKYYYSPFYIEEQVPGYHARIARLGGRLLGFTRDGRYCAFAGDRARDFVPERFFEDHPELIVCLAIGGRGIPYPRPVRAGEADDVQGWGIDILELGVREPIATADKYALFEEYGIPAVPHVGPYEAGDLDELRAWMQERNAAGCVGLVLKPSERHHRPLQYALPASLREPAPAWSGFEDDLGEDPYMERLVRIACAATELGEGADALDWEAAGRALLGPLATATAAVAAGEVLEEELEVRLHTRKAAEELIAQLAQRAPDGAVERLALEADGEGWRLRFRQRFPGATAALQRRLSGASYRDG